MSASLSIKGAYPLPAEVEQMPKAIQDIYHYLMSEWPSPLVSRTQIEAFSGGLLRRGTMANWDSRKVGIKTRLEFKGQRVCYRKEDVALYIVMNLEVIDR